MNRRKFLIFCFPLGRVGQGSHRNLCRCEELGRILHFNQQQIVSTPGLFSTLGWFVLKCPCPPALDCKPHRKLMFLFAPRGQEALCGHVK